MTSLVECIRLAEEQSTGEIHVHIDSNTQENNAQVAFDEFVSLCKGKTAELNAVLFHINFQQKYLTIIGDEGIHQKVKQNFWDTLHDEITEGFAQKKYYEALALAIEKTGSKLKKHFPIKGENKNELPNEITFS